MVLWLHRDFRDYPNDPDDYELLEELGKGASATVSHSHTSKTNGQSAACVQQPIFTSTDIAAGAFRRCPCCTRLSPCALDLIP